MMGRLVLGAAMMLLVAGCAPPYYTANHPTASSSDIQRVDMPDGTWCYVLYAYRVVMSCVRP